MSETYVAWNGEIYPWPPPTGWELRSDNRYWPRETAQHAPPSPPPPPASPLPPQFSAPQMAPAPAAPPGPQYATRPPNQGMSGAMKVFLGVLAAIAVLVVGCSVVVTAGIAQFSGEIEDAVNDFEQAQEDAFNEASIVDGTCRVDAGNAIAEVLVENESGGRSDYQITVEFTDDFGDETTANVSISNLASGDSVTKTARSVVTVQANGLTCRIAEVFRVGSR